MTILDSLSTILVIKNKTYLYSSPTKSGLIVTTVKGSYNYHSYGVAIDIVKMLNKKTIF